MYRKAEHESLVKPEKRKQTLDEWIVDICVVTDCRDGFVSKEVKGYSVLFACPMCDRHERELHPYPCIPSAKHWLGPFLKYTEEEMEARLVDRRFSAERIRKGAGRMPSLAIAEVGEGIYEDPRGGDE